jgi:CRP/FNR family transcriptional regulator/CRP/FNR family cyclic AMP-dependent transcriptional regulator
MASDAVGLLKRVPLFSQLADEMLADLAPHLRRRAFRKNTMIFHRDQTGDALYIIETGKVRVFLPTESGEEFSIDVLGPGDVFGEMALLDGQPRSASAIALEDTTVHVLGHTEFQRQLAASPQLASALLAMLSRRIRHVLDNAEILASLDVYGRLARVLLDMAQRHGMQDKGIVINVALTQQELATMVGATRERINRALATFKTQRLIEMRGRKIAVLDASRLREQVY